MVKEVSLILLVCLPKKKTYLKLKSPFFLSIDMGIGQNLVPLVNIKIAGKWMFIPLEMYL
jgi:hypothetical protein